MTEYVGPSWVRTEGRAGLAAYTSVTLNQGVHICIEAPEVPEGHIIKYFLEWRCACRPITKKQDFARGAAETIRQSRIMRRKRRLLR